MKLAFMTFIAPQWSLTEHLTAAVRYGYEGLEPRAEAGQQHGVELTTTKKERAEIAARFRDSGVELCCLATSRTYALEPAAQAESVELTRRLVELVRDCGGDKLRVFGGIPPPGMTLEDSRRRIAEGLVACVEAAAAAQVYLCLETHDSLCHAGHVREILEAVNSPWVAANWDLMHPVFSGGQTMPEAFDDLRPWIRHCHVHDGVQDEGGLAFRPLGEGVLDHRQAVRLLAAAGYAGYLSGEWIGVEREAYLPHDVRVLREYLADVG